MMSDVIDLAAVRLLMETLVRWAVPQPEGLCYFSGDEQLATDCGVSCSDIRTRLDAFETAGLVRQEKRWEDGFQLNDRVVLLFGPDSVAPKTMPPAHQAANDTRPTLRMRRGENGGEQS